jgi:hypothetical protein
VLISFCLPFIVTGHKLQLQQRQNGGDRHNHDDQQSPQRSSDGGGDIQPFDYEIDGSSSDYNDIDEKSPRLRHREATSKARKKSSFTPTRASNSMILEEMEDFDDDFGDDFI